MTTKAKLRRLAIQITQFIAMLTLSLIAMNALAQTTSVSLGDLQVAAEGPHDDAAMRMLKGLLGEEFASVNPFESAGLPATLIGSLFGIFNSIVFTIGAAWAGYGIITTIAQSAADGEPLSKSSTLWTPIRVGTGIFGMLPVVGGFSVFQAITMTAIALGIGAANILTNKVVDSAAEFKAITPSYSSAAAAPNLSTDIQNAVRGVVLAELCNEGRRLWVESVRTVLPNAQIPEPKWYETKKDAGFLYSGCGKVEISMRGDEQPRDDSLIGFRNSAVDYKTISTAVRAAATAELKTIQAEANAIATDWMRAYYAASYAEEPRAKIDMMTETRRVYDRTNALEIAARARLNNAIAAAAGADTSAIQSETLQKIKDKGWMGLGSYYSVFAETSAALADAQRAFQIIVTPSHDLQKTLSDGRLNGGPAGEALFQFLTLAENEESAENDKGIFDKILDFFAQENEMGTRSLGQHIVNKLIDGAAADSGGAGLVNPVIAAKNLGDWLMIAGQATLATDLVPQKKVAELVNPIAWKLGEIGRVAGWAMIAIGLFLSVFIPMSVWATWISGVLIYLTSILESLIYAQLAALSHVKTDGDKFVDAGSSAAKFYVYLLNCLLRPGLMVIAFVLASALLTFTGTFIIDGFSAAMSAAQGNSTTGALSIVGYLLLFCVILFGLVQTCASLIIDIPDRLLGWIGGHAESNKNGPIAGAAAAQAMRGIKGPVSNGAGAAAKAVKPKTQE